MRGAAAFETWLLARQRHAAAASEAILHEAALGSMARGALEEAIAEAGSAVVAAGVTEAGVHSPRTAARLADGAGATRLRVSARLALAEALIHALGGLDEQGLAALHEAAEIALAGGLREAVAQARAELGYVDFLRGRYDRAEVWLTDALELGGDVLPVRAKAMTYLGAVASDRADYQHAAGLLEQAVRKPACRSATRRRRHRSRRRS